jgi:hypothetical protein
MHFDLNARLSELILTGYGFVRDVPVEALVERANATAEAFIKSHMDRGGIVKIPTDQQPNMF